MEAMARTIAIGVRLEALVRGRPFHAAKDDAVNKFWIVVAIPAGGQSSGTVGLSRMLFSSV